MPEPEKTTIQIVYRDSPGRVTVPAAGVWGGTNFQGQIVAHLYIETPVYPAGTTVKINPADGHFTESSLSGSVSIAREVQVSLLLDPDAAAVIGQWLQQHASRAKQLVAAGPATKT